MDNATRQALNAINQRFYAATAADFDASRATPWSGWTQALSHLDAPVTSVLDLGCGNGRFARFLLESGYAPLRYQGLDNSPALLNAARAALTALPGLHDLTLTLHDLVTDGLPEDGGARYDLVVLFGVMHHLPGTDFRRALLTAAAQRVAPGGALIFTAWRFADDPRLSPRITPWRADLAALVEPGDHLLDWRRGTVALRYCHHIDAAEHDALVTATGLEEAARFSADGRDGQRNRYSVLLRRPPYNES